METNEHSKTDVKLLADRIKAEVHKVIVGQDSLIDQLIAGILANGHILIEGVPGIAKTLAAKLIAKSISCGFSRIQFTPDLMPSDILGTNVFNVKESRFEFHAGPIFANLILIDEINRSPAKTQSALFEAMEERQISIDGTTRIMDLPFLVFATQNPIEHEGTYRLPEAQLDRFIFKIIINYPEQEQEIEILNRAHNRKSRPETEEINAVAGKEEILAAQEAVKLIHIEEPLRKYIAQIVGLTRNNPSIYLGASPRASIHLMNAAKAFAAIEGRDFVIPEDIRLAAIPVLNHRILLTPEKEMEGITTDRVIRQIIDTLEVPR
ncbi:MAG: MoxR family ATPase [Bacteroidetes bacterium]|nr:MoxR family ATPase [Bacteroidota bacterium]MBU1717746.1 MoxR family ATPase [Bacteroidota bacterium]